MKQLRIAIAGFGIVGKRRKMCIERCNAAKLVAVCDRTFAGEGYLPEGIAYFFSYERLLQLELDVLIVCMTNDIAAEVTIAGLRKGLHVFCEKPPGRDLEDVKRVMEVKERYPSLKLMYGFNHRYHESVQEALAIVRSERLGPIINMRGVYGKSKIVTFNQPDWRTKRELAGGGVLLDQGIHMVDLMRLFAGEFDQVHSFISNSHWKYDIEDNAYALMKSQTGIVGILHSSATQWRHRFHLDINLKRGSIILGGILSSSKSYGAETLTVAIADPENDLGDPKEYTTHYNKDPSWDEEIKYFVKAIVEDAPINSGSVQDAYQTMKLVYQIYYADPVWRDTYKIKNPEQ